MWTKHISDTAWTNPFIYSMFDIEGICSKWNIYSKVFWGVRISSLLVSKYGSTTHKKIKSPAAPKFWIKTLPEILLEMSGPLGKRGWQSHWIRDFYWWMALIDWIYITFDLWIWILYSYPFIGLFLPQARPNRQPLAQIGHLFSWSWSSAQGSKGCGWWCAWPKGCGWVIWFWHGLIWDGLHLVDVWMSSCIPLIFGWCPLNLKRLQHAENRR